MKRSSKRLANECMGKWILSNLEVSHGGIGVLGGTTFLLQGLWDDATMVKNRENEGIWEKWVWTKINLLLGQKWVKDVILRVNVVGKRQELGQKWWTWSAALRVLFWDFWTWGSIWRIESVKVIQWWWEMVLSVWFGKKMENKWMIEDRESYGCTLMAETIRGQMKRKKKPLEQFYTSQKRKIVHLNGEGVTSRE